jgi:DNA-binding response OmpR family regulator
LRIKLSLFKLLIAGLQEQQHINYLYWHLNHSISKKEAGRAMGTVLVVDDLNSELERISSILKEAGISVVQAHDGDEAIKKVQEALPDLIVLDVIMPRINGFEVIRELREDDKTKKLPIIICTQKNTDIDKIWGMEIGADAYVTKPFDAQQLLSIVQRFL